MIDLAVVAKNFPGFGNPLDLTWDQVNGLLKIHQQMNAPPADDTRARVEHMARMAKLDDDE